MRKIERHSLIKEIISNHVVRTQEELLHYLSQHGVLATQATISRDIRDLNIVKVPDSSGQSKFEIFDGTQAAEDEKTEENQLIRMIEEVVTKVDRVQFLTLINTIPDNAPLLSASIDAVTFSEKVCSLAGFDTVVVISRTEEDAKKMAAYFSSHAII